MCYPFSILSKTVIGRPNQFLIVHDATEGKPQAHQSSKGKSGHQRRTKLSVHVLTYLPGEKTIYSIPAHNQNHAKTGHSHLQRPAAEQKDVKKAESGHYQQQHKQRPRAQTVTPVGYGNPKVIHVSHRFARRRMEMSDAHAHGDHTKDAGSQKIECLNSLYHNQ